MAIFDSEEGSQLQLSTGKILTF